jgi:hypothetical protein
MTAIIERHTDAARVNAVLNHPTVRPWVANGDGEIDITPQLADPRNVLLMGEHGGCMYFHILPGLYEVHTQVLYEGRGSWAQQMAQASLHWMFTRTDCCEVLTRIPRPHVAARSLALRCGMKDEFTRDDPPWPYRDQLVPVDVLSIKLQEWALKAPGLEERGAWFHDRLNAEAQRKSVGAKPHKDDPNHNRFVGACYDMAVNGQVAKAVNFYNRWAFVSRHATVSLASVSPPLIQFDIGLLDLSGGEVKVI